MNNKNRIDSYIPAAIEALKTSGIARNGRVDGSYRGQISSFGAAVTIGSFKQAVAFFSQDAKNGDSKITRSDLIIAINCILYPDEFSDKEYISKNKEKLLKKIKTDILEQDAKSLKTLENQYLDAAVAIKVAMGVYDMTPENN